MRLPYLQLEADFLSTKATVVAALLKVHRHMVVGMATDLFAFAITQTSTDEKPPDGVLLDPDAPTILEAVMGWQGEPGACVGAFTRAGIIQKLDVGVRVRGLDRYAAYWAKAAKDRARKAALRIVPAPPEVARNSSGHPEDVRHDEPGQKKKEKENKKLLPSEEAEAPSAPLPPPPEDRLADWRSFWVWWQHNRVRAGYAREKEPKADAARSFFAELMLETNGSGELIDEAIAAYAQDPFWKPKKLPFGGFMSQWRSFLPRRVA